MKRALLAAVWLLGPVMAGCAHHSYHEAKADYHHEKAAHEWDTGHPIGAAKQKVKETHEDIKAHD
jgi:hypothetical protein